MSKFATFSLIISGVMTFAFYFIGRHYSKDIIPGPGAGYGPSFFYGILSAVSAFLFLLSLIIFLLVKVFVPVKSKIPENVNLDNSVQGKTIYKSPGFLLMTIMVISAVILIFIIVYNNIWVSI